MLFRSRGLGIDPTSPMVLVESSRLLRVLGRSQEEIAILEFLTERDPLNSTSWNNQAIAYRYAGRKAESIAAARTVLNLNERRGAAQFQLGLSLLVNGDAEAALAAFGSESVPAWKRIGLPMGYHAIGQKAESDAALAELIEKDSGDAAYNIAYVLAFRGEVDRAFDWLEKAVEQRDSGLSELAVDPLFLPLRGDRRWLPLLRRLGKAPEQLAAIQFRVTLPK